MGGYSPQQHTKRKGEIIPIAGVEENDASERGGVPAQHPHHGRRGGEKKKPACPEEKKVFLPPWYLIERSNPSEVPRRPDPENHGKREKGEEKGEDSEGKHLVGGKRKKNHPSLLLNLLLEKA